MRRTRRAATWSALACAAAIALPYSAWAQSAHAAAKQTEPQQAAPKQAEHEQTAAAQTHDRASAAFAIGEGIGRFESRLERVDNDWIERAYAASLRERFASRPNAKADVAAILNNIAQEGADSFGYARWTLREPTFAGDWHFSAPDGGLPTRAWRDIDRSDGQDYAAERIGYCRGSQAVCDAWFEADRHRAAEPSAAEDAPAWRQWRNRVVQEPCIPAPKRAPSTARLGVIIARSGLDSASVNLRVLLNPCGEVRHAQIAKSSGLPELDEATVRWAQRASFPEVVAAMPGFGGIGVLPLKFEAAD